MSRVTCKKAFNFDLDTHKLKEFYPTRHWRNAYKEIGNFIKNENFIHRQGSGYVSNEKLSLNDVDFIIVKMCKSMPWLKKCVNHFDVTDIGRQHDLTHLITGGDRSRSRSKNILPAKKEKKQFKFSMKEFLKEGQERQRQKERETSPKEHKRSNNLER